MNGLIRMVLVVLVLAGCGDSSPSAPEIVTATLQAMAMADTIPRLPHDSLGLIPRQPITSHCLPAVSSFNARAVTPRLNRVSWRLPSQVTGCPYTGLQIDVWTPDANGFVHVSDTTSVFLHGMEDTCIGPSCHPLTDADSVVAYKIRTFTTDSVSYHVPGAWSRQITVRRNASVDPSVPLGLTVIHNEGGYADLSWSHPTFPADPAGITYDLQRRPGARGSWSSLPSVDSAVSTRISFADLPPVGVRSKQTFRVRSVHNGRRSAWVESDGNLETWPAPKAFRLLYVGLLGTDPDKFARFAGTALDDYDSHRFHGYTFTCEFSVGDRRNYAPNATLERLCKFVGGGIGLRVEVENLPAGETTWVKVTAERKMIVGASVEVSVTISANSMASSPDTVPTVTGPIQTTCESVSAGHGTSNTCERPDDPDAVASWAPGSVTVSFSATYPGSNPNGTDARVTRIEMKYRACPYVWRNGGWVKVGEHGGDNDSCRHGTRARNSSSGSMTFTGSFGAAIDMWNTKVEGRVRNSRGRWSGWAGGGGHVTP